MATSNGGLLEVMDLNAYYGPAHVLQGLDFSVADEPVSVIGRNGMGKTTLCNTIMGIHPSGSSGSVRFGGLELLGKAPYKVARAGIALVPQGRRLFGSLTVAEHLRVATRRSKAGQWTAERIYELFPRLAERRKNDATQLSGGEQQMLAIGRALTLNPKVLLLDEPTEGLAPIIVEELLKAIGTITRAGGICSIIVEQNAQKILGLADRVVILERGTIVHDAPSAALKADPSVLERHLGVAGAAAH